MKKLLSLLLIFGIVGCSSELSRCIDANTNTKDSKFNKILTLYKQSKTSMKDYNQYLLDVPASIAPTEQEYTKMEDAYYKGSGMLMELEYSLYKKNLFDEANSKAISCFFYGEELDKYNNVYSGSLNYGKKKLKKCYEKHVVNSESAEKICNQQGIY